MLRVDAGGRTFREGEPVTIVIRPECVTIDAETSNGVDSGNVWHGEIASSSFLGRMIRYWVRCGSQTCIVDDVSPSTKGFLQGSVRMQLDMNKMHVLPGHHQQ